MTSMSSPQALVWAQDIGDVIGILIVLLFVLLPAVGQLLSKRRAGGQRRRVGRPIAQAPRRPARAGLEDEIGDFLRRAAKRRGAERAGAPPPPPEAAAVEAEIVPERPVGDEVREHVGKYLNSGKFRRRSSRLGRDLAGTDERLEQHLHQVFDHQVSRLAGRAGEVAQTPGVLEPTETEDRLGELPSTAAVGLAAMLSSGESLRQAIVISEILQRPEHRWT